MIATLLNINRKFLMTLFYYFRELFMRSPFIRYVFVGGTAFLADLLSYYLFRDTFGMSLLAATTSAFLVGSVVNYCLSIRIVFSVRAVSNRQLEFLVFVLIGAAGVGVNALLIYTFLAQIGLSYLFAKIISAATLLVFNFQARKFALFSR